MQNGNEENKEEVFRERLKAVFQELNRLTVWYEETAKKIISLPLIINAGALIALVTFFTERSSGLPSGEIKYGAIFFMLGTVFGILTLVFEYCTSYFGWTIYKKHLWDNINEADYLADLVNRFEQHNKGLELRISKTIKIRIFNGALGVVCCFLGIFFIGRYIVGNYCLITIGLLVFIIYFIVMMSLLYFAQRPSKG